MMKAVTVGSATVDIIAAVRSDDIERMTLHNVTASFLLLEPGRKVDAEAITTHTGGGAVNAAVSLARQGFEVAALVKLGRDLNAEKILERFDEEGISRRLVSRHASELTAVSVMISSHERNAAIFTHRGANGFLMDADVPPAAFEGAALVYVTNLSNDSAERFPDIVARAKAAGAFVTANPGILQLTRRTAAFFDSLGQVDLFICNFQEARALLPALVDRTGWEKKASARSPGIGPTLAIEGFKLSLGEYAERLQGLGPRYIGVTNGADGAYVFDGTVLHHQPALPVEVMGTAGAGDAFASTLAGALVRDLGIERAAHLAAVNAASVVGQIDAQSGLLRQEALLAWAGVELTVA